MAGKASLVPGQQGEPEAAAEERMVSPQVARIILYVQDISKVASFYQSHFGLLPQPGAEPGWLELAPANGGCAIALHQAAKSQKRGSEIKIVFGVRDVPAFKKERERQGLKFGVVHEVGGFMFSNAKDPAGNAIQISSRGLVQARAAGENP